MERWEPADEAAILLAIREGTLAESVHLDVKRQVGSTDGARRETARDLASFAVDGGALLIGVEEDQSARTWTLSPQALAGLVERVELIAENLIDPPLHVRPREIPSGADPSQGYLWVHVPASLQAPHMTGGVYYGRGERTRRRLTDGDVLRLHASRRGVEALALEQLRDEIDWDPVAKVRPRTGHLFLVAAPLATTSEMAVEVVADREALQRAVLNSLRGVPGGLAGHDPTEAMATNLHRVADGMSLSSYRPGPDGRSLPSPGSDSEFEESIVNITFREDGGVRVTVGRASVEHAGTLWVRDGLIYAWTLRLLNLVEHVAKTARFTGSWGLAVHVNGLSGASSSHYMQDAFDRTGPVYDRDSFQRATTATFSEIAEQPGRIIERLLGALARSLAVAHVLDTPT